MHVLFPLKLIQNVSVLFFKAKDNGIEDEQNKAKPKNEKKRKYSFKAMGFRKTLPNGVIILFSL